MVTMKRDWKKPSRIKISEAGYDGVKDFLELTEFKNWVSNLYHDTKRVGIFGLSSLQKKLLKLENIVEWLYGFWISHFILTKPLLDNYVRIVIRFNIETRKNNEKVPEVKKSKATPSPRFCLKLINQSLSHFQ